MNKIFKRLSIDDEEYRNLIFDMIGSSLVICDESSNSAIYALAVKLLERSCEKMSLFELNSIPETLDGMEFKNIPEFSCFIYEIADELSCWSIINPADGCTNSDIRDALGELIRLSRYLVRGEWHE